MSETLIPSQRHLFSIPRDLAYFNVAYLAPQLNSASEAAAAAATIKQSPWNVSADDFFAGPEKARGLFADIVGCAAENIALVPAVSYGVAIAGKNLLPGAGQRIVMLAEQFPSNVYSWLALAHERDLVIDFVQKADGRTWSESVLESLDEPAALVALPNVHWTDGSLIDLAPIAKRCHAMGAKLVLDLTQSMGALRAGRYRDIAADTRVGGRQYRRNRLTDQRKDRCRGCPAWPGSARTARLAFAGYTLVRQSTH